MTHLTIIEDGEAVGYVDTEKLEVEYNGSEDDLEFILGRLEDRVSLGMSKDDLYGEEVFLEGERAEEYVEEVAEEYDFTIRRRDEKN